MEPHSVLKRLAVTLALCLAATAAAPATSVTIAAQTSAVAQIGRAAPAAAVSNPIAIENAQPGSSAWTFSGPVANDTSGQVKGYASATSVSQSQSLTLFVSVNPAQTYSIDFFRMGWYGGLGGRLLQHVGPLNGAHQANCLPDATTGLTDCAWTGSYTVTVPSSWTSGVYVALLTNEQGYQNYVVFVVKDGRPGAFVYQQGVNTAQAYNNYPDDGLTGKSLYDYNSYGANTLTGTKRAVKVSFDRPYAREGFGDLFLWEIQLIRWLERSGYDVTYTTDVDTHTNGGALLGAKAFFSTGHNEYWSKPMRDSVEGARDAGVSLAFFGANALFWQVRFESSVSGVSNRVIVCYKDGTLDPVQGPTTTVNWRAAPVNRPEQALMGVMFASEVPFGTNLGYVVRNSSHWVYTGTGLKDGDVVPGIVGYEMDRFKAEYPPPSSTNQTLLSETPFTDDLGRPDLAHSSIYQAPSGAWVFATGTMSWSWGLDPFGNGVPDARIQRTTANVLNSFLGGRPLLSDVVVTAPATATAGAPLSVTLAAVDAQGNAVTQYTGPVHFSSSDTSSGVVLPPDANLNRGAGTFSVTLATVGAQTITVTDSANAITKTLAVTVGPGPAAALTLATPPSAQANQPFNVTLTATDRFGNLATGYTGTVHFSSSDSAPLVRLPANYTFGAADAGAHLFAVTLLTAPSQSLSVSDGALSTSASLLVQPGPASRFVLGTTTPTPTAGTPFPFSLSAQDAYGNTATSYAGTVHFTASDSSAGVVLPADATLSAGAGTFSATLDRAGAQSVSATDTASASITGTLGVSIQPGPAAALTLATPAATKMNQPFNVTVTLRDRFGNLATGYTGTVHFSTTDISPLVSLPANYAFSAADAGTHVFSVTLQTPPSQTLTVTDVANASLTTTSAAIAVNLPLP